MSCSSIGSIGNGLHILGFGAGLTLQKKEIIGREQKRAVEKEQADDLHR